MPGNYAGLSQEFLVVDNQVGDEKEIAPVWRPSSPTHSKREDFMTDRIDLAHGCLLCLDKHINNLSHSNTEKPYKQTNHKLIDTNTNTNTTI